MNNECSERLKITGREKDDEVRERLPLGWTPSPAYPGRLGAAGSVLITQNGDWGTRRGSGDLLRIGSFNLYLGSFFKEILNLDRKFEIPIVLLNMARLVIAVKNREI